MRHYVMEGKLHIYFTLVGIILFLGLGCRMMVTQTIKTEDGLTKLTNVSCKKCRSHGGDALVVEISYEHIYHDSLTKNNLDVEVYTNTGHNPVDLTITRSELREKDSTYILILNYLMDNGKKKESVLSWNR